MLLFALQALQIQYIITTYESLWFLIIYQWSVIFSLTVPRGGRTKQEREKTLENGAKTNITNEISERRIPSSSFFLNCVVCWSFKESLYLWKFHFKRTWVLCVLENFWIRRFRVGDLGHLWNGFWSCVEISAVQTETMIGDLQKNTYCVNQTGNNTLESIIHFT